ncbi:hypothetical protein [uncultured Aquimarina sp.]|uniref:hypothetical protein n=1 Tax=uncultured Aquimarina sp. TaxID=575652 RepID=UPI0026327E44|nr:hypothetical protein [uncultured Aquimarina sp.]
MKTNDEAPYVNEEFIMIQINRAFEGMHTLRVQNNGGYYAELKGDTLIYRNGYGIYKGKRNLKAARKIFEGLINTYQNFKVNEICYFYGRGVWKWYTDFSYKE